MRREPIQPGLENDFGTSRQTAVGAAVLADVADMLANQLRLPPEVETGDSCLTGRRRHQSGEHPECGRLSGSIWPEKPEYQSSFYVQVNAGDSLHWAPAVRENSSEPMGLNCRSAFVYPHS